jgi:uncharacterized protein (TIGR02145 family)
MIAYIFKSSLSLIILFGLYWFLLRKEKLFVFNRFFLIASVVFSLVVPFISIPVNFKVAPQLNEIIPTNNYAIPEIGTPDNIVASDTNISQSSPGMHPSAINISAILLVLYFSGVILFLIRFLKNLFMIIRRSKLSEKINFKGYRIVLTNDKTSPCCFFNSIYLNRDDYLNGEIDKELLGHELEHVRQSHTIDIILIELVKIFYWFNPIHVLYDRAIRINHEYLADNGVINDNHDIKSYADKLLNFITGRSDISLASGSNHSFTKKRLLMLTKTKSKSFIYGLRITIALSLILIFSLLISFKQSNRQPLNKDADSSGLTDLQTRTVKDINGNVYNTVTIGKQVWMKENLKTTKYNDGTAIPKIKVNSTWASLTTGAYCDYENTPTNSTTYGRLYNWYVIDNNTATKVSGNGGKNVCPAGWHVPTEVEWATLKTYLGGDSVAGGLLKETGSSHWVDPNWGASNGSGFTALPGGGRYPDGRFSRLWDEGHWWSATEFFYPPTDKNATLAWFSTINYRDGKVSWDNGTKNCGFSVRCLMDDTKEISNASIKSGNQSSDLEISNIKDTLQPHIYHANTNTTDNKITTLKGNVIITFFDKNNRENTIKADSAIFEKDKNIIIAYNGTIAAYNSGKNNPMQSISFKEMNYDVTSRRVILKNISGTIINDNILHVYEKPELFPIKKDEYTGLPSKYGEKRINPINKKDTVIHYGFDIEAKSGTVVMATAGGKVIKASWDAKGFGNLIVIDHGEGYQSWYAHLQDFSVNNGDSVVKGQTIGHVGTSGISTGPHLHFEIRLNGTSVDPVIYLK